MTFKIALFVSLLFGGAVYALDAPPKYLYKILSIEDWDLSREEGRVILPPEDEAFIHLAKRDQVDRIIDKFWDGVREFVILKVKTAELPGKLVYEANTGGTNYYYHLYGGTIPLDSIAEVKFINRGYTLPPVPTDF